MAGGLKISYLLLDGRQQLLEISEGLIAHCVALELLAVSPFWMVN